MNKEIMIVQSIKVNAGRKVAQDQNENSLEIGLQVNIEPDEDFESVYQSLKNALEGQLDTWEFEIKTNERPSVITIPEMNEATAPPLVTASEMKPKLAKVKKENKKITRQEQNNQEEMKQTKQDEYICPTCGEKMMPKEGKDYFLCSKHWGYPDMINKGQVRERKF